MVCPLMSINEKILSKIKKWGVWLGGRQEATHGRCAN